MISKLEPPTLVNMFQVAAKQLKSNYQYLNSINVFPVADGDTGSNMSFTMNKLIKSIEKYTSDGKSYSKSHSKSHSLYDILELIEKNVVIYSRGNSGTLLASFISGFVNTLKAQTLKTKNNLNNNEFEITAKYIAISFESGTQKARDSVLDPKKGTILDVFESFSLEFSNQAKSESDLVLIWDRALIKAKSSLDLTRNILPQVKKAKVIDAGAAGAYIILNGFRDGLAESAGINLNNNADDFESNKSTENTEDRNKTILDQNDFVDVSNIILDNAELVYKFCLEILATNIENQAKYTDFITEIQKHGDSLQVINSSETIKIHIHTNATDKVLKLVKSQTTIESHKVDDMSQMQSKWLVDRHQNQSKKISDKLKAIAKHNKNQVKKVKLLIITDTSADLPKGLKDRFPIWQLPLPVYTNESPEINWSEEITIDQFYKKMETESDFFPKTSKISTGIFVETYKNALEFAEKILVLPISLGMSGTFESAIKAKEEFKTNRIAVLDSQTSSAGLGLQIKYIFENLALLENLDEIVNALIYFRSKLKVYFSVGDIKYLENGGRISKNQGRVARFLGISPLLMLKSGKIENTGEKVFFANNTKIADLLHNKIYTHNKNQRIQDLFLVYAGEEGKLKTDYLIEKIVATTGFTVDQNQVIPLTSVVGAHVGPGSIGMIFT